MTKELRLSFDNEVFKKMQKLKDINKMTWKQFIYVLIIKSERENQFKRKLKGGKNE